MDRTPRPRSRTALPLALLLALTLAACEEDVIVVSGTERPYSVYGVLNPAADTQKVRVFPIEGVLAPSPGAPIDATVISTDLGTGEQRVWEDSLVAYPDGTYGYLFWSPFRPFGGRPYRIEVRRSDGATSHAAVTVPRTPDYRPPVISGQDVMQPVDLGVEGAHVRSMEVRYAFTYCWATWAHGEMTFSYEDRVVPAGSGLQLQLDLDGDFATIRDSLALRGRYRDDYGLVPLFVAVRTTVTDPGWDPPGGVFDPEVLVEPGVMTNVQNGFGFLGSGYDATYGVPIDAQTYLAAGFQPVEPPRPERETCGTPDKDPELPPPLF